jgi:hypothetical protein
MPGERWEPDERDRRYAEAKRAGRRRFISEGDSWFDYPPHRNIIDWLDSRNKYALMRFEVSGDTVAGMTTDANLEFLKAAVKKVKPEGLLFSGGGNDLFTKIAQFPAFRWIYLAFRDFEPGASARDLIDGAAWDSKKTELRLGYVRLINALGALSPIVVHGYDYLVPNGKPALYDGFRVDGPWILPAMKKRGITDEKLQKAVLKELIDDFNRILESLQRTYPATVLYVDLRGTLDPKTDWLNEIHAGEEGYKRISGVFADALDKRLPKLIARRAGAVLP